MPKKIRSALFKDFYNNSAIMIMQRRLCKGADLYVGGAALKEYQSDIQITRILIGVYKQMDFAFFRFNCI